MAKKKTRKLLTEDDLYAGEAPKDLGMAFRRVGPRPSLLIGHALGLFKKSKKKRQEYTNIDGMKIAIRKDHRGKKPEYKD
jgi:hypothetical protein